MNLHWLTPGSIKELKSLHNSNLASVRMRIGIVSENSESMKINFTAGDIAPKNTDILLIGKIGSDCKNGRDQLWTDQINLHHKSSRKVLLDYTDHHLGNYLSPMHNFYKNLIAICDKAVVPSDKMFELLSEHFSGEIQIIEDPIEIQVIPPKKINLCNDLTLLWFGHGSNISFLLEYLNNFELCDLKINLIVLSNNYGIEAIAANRDNLKSRVMIFAEQWSLNNMIKAADLAHACIIPAGIDSSSKVGASSNRLITSFGLGLPVSADNLDSYLPFSNYYHQMRTSPLSDFINNYAMYNEKIQSAQKDIVPIFAKENILKKWGKLFYDSI